MTISLLILLYINPKLLGKTTSTPEVLSAIPMSLWNVALELHVGRCYSPLLGPLSDLFVFLSGLLITLVLLWLYYSASAKEELQTSSEISLTKSIFAHCSASVSLLPISQEAKPH